jgi:hypothetical protein
MPDEAINKVIDALEEIEKEHSGENLKDGEKISDEDVWWYDTYFNVEQIFQMTTIKICGDVPYNNYDKLVSALTEKLSSVTITSEKSNETAELSTRVEMLTNKKVNVNIVKKTETSLIEILETISYSE